MMPVKIAFTKKYFPEQYHGEDYYIEYILEEGDTLQDAFKKAKEETLQCFKNNNPQIQWYPEVIQVNSKHWNMNEVLPLSAKHMDESFAKIIKENPPQISENQIQKGTIEEQIEACTTLKALKEFELLAGMNKKYKAVYDEKMSSLTIGNKLQTT